MMGMQGMNPMVNGKTYPTLYVGDLEDRVTEEMLYQHFVKYGDIHNVKIIKDANKKSRGFGFVSYFANKNAEAARVSANHEKILSNPIRVSYKRDGRVQTNTDANVFVKNLDPNVDVKLLDSVFSQYGTISSSKIAFND